MNSSDQSAELGCRVEAVTCAIAGDSTVNFFGIGLPEMVLILVVALLIFGPKKLPEIGKSLGKAIRSFQEASKEFEEEFKREAERIEKTVKDEPMQATLEKPAQPVLAASASDAITPDLSQSENAAEPQLTDSLTESSEATHS